MPPSEDLTDEIEAINSIYGYGTLLLTGEHDRDGHGTIAVLAVPTSMDDVVDPTIDDSASILGHRLCLRLRFPPAYPASPKAPDVLGIVSVGGAKARRPGAAARDVERVRAALTATFVEGQVCLYDAIEELLRVQQEEADAEAEAEAEAEEEDDEEGAARPERVVQLPAEALLTAPPPWTIADPLIELKSVFVARCATVTSPAQADAYVQHLLATDKRVRSATHNMTAWRIRQDPSDSAKSSSGVVFQDCDDDGETAAGGRLLHLMQLMDLWNVMVVVTRWYGGHKLGPRRFALINQAARDSFVKAGLVPEPASKKKK